MIQTKELTLEEYEKSLKKSKKETVISIALHHIRKSRELKQKIINLLCVGDIPIYETIENPTLEIWKFDPRPITEGLIIKGGINKPKNNPPPKRCGQK
jgi:hypothetical protein